MTTVQILTALGIGTLSGVVAALCGVGGGVVMVPAFVFFMGMTQKNAVATSLMVMIATAITASIQNNKNGFGDWRVALVAALASALVAFFAADMLKTLSNHTLTRIFAIVMITIGIIMLVQKR
jgi:uncharacterized protein